MIKTLILVFFLIPCFAFSQFEKQFDDGRILTKRKTTDFNKNEIEKLKSQSTVSITLVLVNEAGIRIGEVEDATIELYKSTGQTYSPYKKDDVYHDTLPEGKYHIYLNKNDSKRNRLDTNSIYISNINAIDRAYLCDFDVKGLAHNEFKIKVLHTAYLDLFKPVEIELLKPVIYLYSQTPTEASLDLKVNGNLTFSYPSYNEGWRVKVDSSGLYHQGEKYPYLFWEGNKKMPKFIQEGFCVKGENIVEFLENKLDTMGFSAKEKTDFITFWGPKMQRNSYNSIRFIFGGAYEDLAELNISPKPDNLLRVFMIYETSNEWIELEEQVLPTFKREGFYLLEWGGGELKPQNRSL